MLFLVIYGILQWLYMMSIAAFLFAWVYIMRENNSAPIVDVQVTENGIQIQDTFYDYPQITNFAILYDQQVARILRIALRKWITPSIDIPLVSEEVNVSELKNFLLNYLSENTNAEFSKSDRVIQAMRL